MKENNIIEMCSLLLAVIIPVFYYIINYIKQKNK